MLKAYKTELDPNNKQKTFFWQCTGTNRFVYNWALAEWENWYELGGNPTAYSVRRYFNSIKYESFPWIAQVPYAITDAAFLHLKAAFRRYFDEKKDGTVAKRVTNMKDRGVWDRRAKKLRAKGRGGYKMDPGYPQFKRKFGQNAQSFQLRNTKIERDRVRLTGIGWIRLKERGYLPETGSAKHGTFATISHRAGRWYISVQAQAEDPVPPPLRESFVLGIDMGIKTRAAFSNGEMMDVPKAAYLYAAKITRLQRELSRRTKGGKNWKKTKIKLARAYAKAADIRKWWLHQISHHTTAELQPEAIVLEDLNVSGMSKNKHLSRSVQDAGFYELRRQIEYKAARLGIKVIIADRWFPSSKTCSRCGHKIEKLGISTRTFVCPECGLVMDRDLNAAINLSNIGQAEINREPRSTRGLLAELDG